MQISITAEDILPLLRSVLPTAPEDSQPPPPQGEYIVVLDRGFVYVGKAQIRGQWLHLEDAKNIRVWGTTNGLGELRNGPLQNTKLDPAGSVVAPLKSVIHLIPCRGF